MPIAVLSRLGTPAHFESVVAATDATSRLQMFRARNELSWSGVRPYCSPHVNVCGFSALNWLNFADFASGWSRPRKEKWPDAPKSPAFGRAGGRIGRGDRQLRGEADRPQRDTRTTPADADKANAPALKSWSRAVPPLPADEGRVEDRPDAKTKRARCATVPIWAVIRTIHVATCSPSVTRSGSKGTSFLPSEDSFRE